MKHPSRFCTLLVLLVLSMATLATAQVGLAPVQTRDTQLYTATDERPYQYFHVVLENPNNRPLGYEWSASSMMNTRFDLPDGRLEPGRSRVWHVPIANAAGHLRLYVRSARQEPSNVATLMQTVVLGIDPIAQWPSDAEREAYSDAIQGTAGSERVVHYIEPPQAPDNWLCYSPFRMVTIGEAAFRSLETAQRTALMEYARMGGYLTIHGTEKPSKERLLEGWIEHRPDHPVKALAMAEWKSGLPEWMRFHNKMSGTQRKAFPFRVNNPGGRVGGLLIATLFFILAGPVNYFYWRSRKRIRMLLVSLPAISIAFCLFIGAYFLIAQGFQRKGGTVSFTLLDESRAAAMTIAYHSVISGLYPVGGFRFPLDTAFVTLHNSFSRTRMRGGSDSQMTITETSQVLRSGLFQPGVPFHYLTARPFDTREKLIYDPAKHTAVNGFESDMKMLLVFDGGEVYSTGELRSQGSATLEPEKLRNNTVQRLVKARKDIGANGLNHIEHILRDIIRRQLSQPGRHYLAVLEDAPESADPGISMSRPGGLHVLLGVMPTREN